MQYFELVKSDFKFVNYTTVYRIRAVVDFNTPFGKVKRGDLGGYTNRQDNPNSWIFGNAIVTGSYLDRSFIRGNFHYSRLNMVNCTIDGTCDYKFTGVSSYPKNLNVVGSSCINGNRHPIIWGTDKKTNELKIFVGCRGKSLNTWKRVWNRLANDYGYPTDLRNEYVGYMNKISELVKSGNIQNVQDKNPEILKKVSENVEAMKKTVTEILKTETVNLVNSLTVSKIPEQKTTDPKRDPKTGRFVKKVS